MILDGSRCNCDARLMIISPVAHLVSSSRASSSSAPRSSLERLLRPWLRDHVTESWKYVASGGTHRDYVKYRRYAGCKCCTIGTPLLYLLHTTPLALALLVSPRGDTHFFQKRRYFTSLRSSYIITRAESGYSQCASSSVANSCRPCIAPKSAPAANADMV